MLIVSHNENDTPPLQSSSLKIHIPRLTGKISGKSKLGNILQNTWLEFLKTIKIIKIREVWEIVTSKKSLKRHGYKMQYGIWDEFLEQKRDIR